MEIRDPLHGSIELTPAETAVVDNVYFQRLRNIKQMGFSEFSFPGATHNRYTHSIGAMHLAGTAFDQIFHGYPFSSKEVRWRLRQIVRLAALLHDVGHGPLSHTTEEAMPHLSQLNIKIYKSKTDRRADHEDYTIKIVTDSELSALISDQFKDLSPIHIACLINKNIESPDDFFMDEGFDLRPALSQIISSELDVDRMDYLARDSYYCGTSYGKIDSEWLLSNLTHYRSNDKVFMALNRRALYTFDDFLIARFHMFMMVYFHHKALIYDEMLLKYLKSKDCDFLLPGEITEYVNFDDYRLHTHMSQSSNAWAKRISKRMPFRLIFESHEQETARAQKVEDALKQKDVEYIRSSSSGRLSKYYTGGPSHDHSIYVIDRGTSGQQKVSPIEETTEIFAKYQSARRIERIYVDPQRYTDCQKVLEKLKI